MRRDSLKSRVVNRLHDDAVKGAELGVFVQELIHSTAWSVGLASAVLIAGQLIIWLEEHNAVHTVEIAVEQVGEKIMELEG